MNRLVTYGRRRLRYGGAKKYGWKLVAPNGKVIATDGRQDYDHAVDAEDMAKDILSGKYSNYRKVRENA
jgi:hypothetical protein